LILLLFGPPGCGKGTQAALLADRYHIPAISTGEMFRAECKAGTPLGKVACSILSSGRLVPDEITNEIVARRIGQPDCRNGFLLDGYPRTVPQAEHFAGMLRQRGLPEPTVIHLDVPERELVSRLTARRQCTQCKRIYNLLSQPPKAANVCDDDGAELMTREDDQEQVIVERLHAYAELTGPILKYYREPAVHRVDASVAPDQVQRAIAKIIAAGADAGQAALLSA
jgi:adenylate kinase